MPPDDARLAILSYLSVITSYSIHYTKLYEYILTYPASSIKVSPIIPVFVKKER